MALQHALIARGYELCDLRRQKALQASDALDLGNLLCDPLLKGPVPGCEIGRLRLHLIMQRLDAQNRSHAGDQRRLVDRLGQIFVGPGVETSHDILRSVLAVTRMMGMNGSVASPLRRRHASMPSSFGIITSRRTRSGLMLLDGSKRLFAVRSLQSLIPVRLQAATQ